MISYKNITIIGTSHISPKSVKDVRELISKTKPDLVAVELDLRRFEGLFSKKRKLSIKDIKYLGVKSFLLNMIGAYFENKLGNITGVSPGSEMKTAILEAKKIDAKIALIDQDISITLKKLSKVPFREKFGIFFESLKNAFRKEKIKFDLKDVPDKETINKMIDLVKKYPNIYKVMIEDRNKFMAKSLNKIKEDYHSIIAVVGAGHEEEIIKEIKNADK